MKINVKSFVIVIIATTMMGLTSCGKGNQTGNNQVPNNNYNSSSNVTSTTYSASSQGASNVNELISEIRNGHFRSQSTDGYYYPGLTNPSNSSTSTFLGIEFTYTQSNGGSCYEVRVNGQAVTRNNGYSSTCGNGGVPAHIPGLFGSTLVSMKQGLLNIVNGATDIIKYNNCGSNYYSYCSPQDTIKGNGAGQNNFYQQGQTQKSQVFDVKYQSKWYRIDLSKALAANPTMMED